MPVSVEAIYHGGRDNGDGEVFIHIDVDNSQMPEVAKCMALTKKQLVVMVNWGDGMRELGIFLYNGKTDQPGGDYTIHLRSDQQGVDAQNFPEFKRQCAGKRKGKDKEGKTFRLVLLTKDELASMFGEEEDADDTQEQQDVPEDRGAEISI